MAAFPPDRTRTAKIKAKPARCAQTAHYATGFNTDGHILGPSSAKYSRFLRLTLTPFKGINSPRND
jgi:hypothetical protein